MKLDVARAQESTLFMGKPWNDSGIESTRMGIDALRTGLSNVFCAHIRSEFPAFNEQTRKILQLKKSRLANLGPARSTVKDQWTYLRSIVKAYQLPKYRLLSDDFSPSNNTEDGSTSLHRRLAYNKKKLLRDQLVGSGASYQFQTPYPGKDLVSDMAASTTGDNRHKNIYTWINTRYQETKFCGIPGIVPYPLIERLFEEQTFNWTTLTKIFLDSVENVFVTAFQHCINKASSNKQVTFALETLVAF